MIYNITYFFKKLTDQDRGHNQATLFNSTWWQTEHLSERSTYPIMVLRSCPNDI